MFYVSRYDGRVRIRTTTDGFDVRRPTSATRGSYVQLTAPTTTDDDRGRHPDDHGRLRRPSIRTTTVDTDISGRFHVGALLVWTLALSLSVVFFSLLSLLSSSSSAAARGRRIKEKKRKEKKRTEQKRTEFSSPPKMERGEAGRLPNTPSGAVITAHLATEEEAPPQQQKSCMTGGPVE